jgi:hypothetical protein
MKALVVLSLVLSGVIAQADGLDTTYTESWKIGAKIFTNKAEAVRYVIANNSQDEIVHTQCEILTNKLTFKACPKNKKASWDTEQFKSLADTK